MDQISTTVHITSPDGTTYEYILHYMNVRDILMSTNSRLLEAVVEWKTPKIVKPKLTWQKLNDIWVAQD